MSETRKTAGWKIAVMAAVGLFLVVDLGLAVLLWELQQSDPAGLRAQNLSLQTKAKLLRADIERCQKIQKNMPAVGKEADAFYQDEIPKVGKGYSGIVADLGDIAVKAGMTTSATGFHEAQVKNRGVTEIGIADSVEGNYNSVLQFITGLERSKNFYLLDGLSMDRAESGHLHLTLELRTYFRI
jgi:Type II secretion system (T2SS), protein M subtype b